MFYLHDMEQNRRGKPPAKDSYAKHYPSKGHMISVSRKY